MLESESSQARRPHPAVTILLLLFLALAGMFVGALLGIELYKIFSSSDVNLLEVLQDMENPRMRPILYAAQGGATLFGMIVAPLVLLTSMRFRVANLLAYKNIPLYIFLVTALIVIFSFGFNSMIMKWNQELVLPEFMQGFEEWARAREAEAARQTEAITKMTGVQDLLIALVVIAILPGIGEELVFRGVIQNEIHFASRNIHVAVWFSAILFSAIHFQFFGFVPRVLLGAMFGYLYYWSGSLWIAIAAHVVNNGMQVLALYYYQQGDFDFDLEQPEAIPLTAVIISALVTGGLLYYFYQYFQNRKPISPA
jgi:uncharacterized protein